MNRFYTRFFCRVCVADSAAAICRAIVDENQFKIWIGLCQDWVQTIWQICFDVIDRNNDRNQRAEHTASLTCWTSGWIEKWIWPSFKIRPLFIGQTKIGLIFFLEISSSLTIERSDILRELSCLFKKVFSIMVFTKILDPEVTVLRPVIDLFLRKSFVMPSVLIACETNQTGRPKAK